MGVIDTDVGQVLYTLCEPGTGQVTWETALWTQECSGRRNWNKNDWF